MVVEAIRRFDSGAQHKFGPSTFYDLLYEGRRYPPKAIVGLAAAAVTGREYVPDDFSGGLDSKCFRILWDAGLETIFKTDNQPLSEEVLPTEKYTEGAVRKVLTNAYERDEKLAVPPSSTMVASARYAVSISRPLTVSSGKISSMCIM